MDIQEFQRIKNTVRILSEAKKVAQTVDVTGDKLPSIFGLKLTNRCNLRCKHCYEWNQDGYHHHLEKTVANGDLPFELIEKCMEETKQQPPAYYLWGGEPLMYYKIRELLTALLPQDPVLAICTNGHLVLDHLDLLQQFSSNLELVFALEGAESQNDALRGQGSFAKTMTAIETLVRLKRENAFFGKLTVHTMISNENTETLESFVQFMQESGVENLILCFPWYLSPACSAEMDAYFRDFPWLQDNAGRLDGKHSWDAFKYHIVPENHACVIETVQRIRAKQWTMNVKIQPDLKEAMMTDFLCGNGDMNTGVSKCLSLYSRMDVLPNGKVTSCKHFPEFVVGDLHAQSVNEIWTSEKMNQVRRIYNVKKSPACTKCNNFYLHGLKKGENM